MQLSVVDQSPVPSGFTPSDALNNSIDLARFTERLGYGRYWIAEHHNTGSLASPAPEILITRVAAETRTMRVGSGAVLLPHYAPLKVVETFRMLHAMFPGRIDLGIGRAPGGSRLDAFALARYRSMEREVDDFPNQLAELLAFLHGTFPESHPFSRITVSPATPGSPDVWLLGSSGWSADAAAQLGLPYAAAHFINPQTTRSSIEHYYEHFKPSEQLKAPYALVCAGAIAADTQAEAQRLYASWRLRRWLRDRGQEESRDSAIPTPEDAIARLGDDAFTPPNDASEWPRMVLGDAAEVHERLSEMADALHIDELMLITVVHSHEARRRSYELMANAFGVVPAATA